MGIPGCGPGGPAPPGPEDITFAPALGVELSAMVRTSTGLCVEDLEEGVGPPAQRTSRGLPAAPRGSARIPSGATLVFEVHVVEVR
jgi:hypothetical protein